MSKRPQQNTHLHGDPAAANIRDPRQTNHELAEQPTPKRKVPNHPILSAKPGMKE
jgi:hypothetical protein